MSVPARLVGFRTALRAQSPGRDFGLVDQVTGVVHRIQAGRTPHDALDILDRSALDEASGLLPAEPD
ncbi:hypothetical protein, partial [Pseudonocardia sp.]|uniref:hypothetical protein n=1 Tax=Pseudonocardia sp. TaxID=60912 RepID=UPI00263127B0